MSKVSPERNLLFGILAVQNGLISKQQLVAAFEQWVQDKQKPFDQILVDQGSLTDSQRQFLNQLVDMNVQNNGDEIQSLQMANQSSIKDLMPSLQELDRKSVDPLPTWQSFESESDEELLPEIKAILQRQEYETGRFRVLRPLEGGAGGMGVINIAEDQELGRKVALKQIRPDQTKRSLFREKFQVEAELTGNLEHPGIVPVYGLGTDAEGDPYYAMRLVRGDNLSMAIRTFHRGLESIELNFTSVEFYELVDRLVDVAQAIEYAHDRGVLHRDLKPGNILVGQYGETLVIDWGLAQLPRGDSQSDPKSDIEPKPNVEPLSIRSGSDFHKTIEGSTLGTPGYAPPEQVSGEIDQISERSDVYSLGAILYQILTNETSVATRIGNEKLTLEQVIDDTKRGKIKPLREVNAAIPKPLSAICHKALSRVPADRYSTVGHFIQEIQRWKADQPVAANPEGMLEKLARFSRKHRAATLATIVTAIGIAIAAVVAAIGIDQQRQIADAARVVAEKERIAANEARLMADNARQDAENESQRKKEVVEILVAAFQSPDPKNEGVTYTMSAKEVLGNAQEKMAGSSLNQDPLTKADLQEVMGRTLLGLGDYDTALESFKAADRIRTMKLGALDPATLMGKSLLANGYLSRGDTEKAIDILKTNLRNRIEVLGEKDLDTLRSKNDLGLGYRTQGELEKAKTKFLEAIEIYKQVVGEKNIDTLTSMNNLALVHHAQGNYEDALKLYGKILPLMEELVGAADVDTLAMMNNFALSTFYSGDQQKAIEIYENVRQLRIKKLGERNPNTLLSGSNLAEALYAAGQTNRAVEILKAAAAIAREDLTINHPWTQGILNNLGAILLNIGEYEQARPILEVVLRVREETLPPNHSNVLLSRTQIAYCHLQSGDAMKAIEIYEDLLPRMKSAIKKDDPVTLQTMNNFARAYRETKQPEKALNLYKEGLDLTREKFGEKDQNTIIRMNNYAKGLISAGRLSDAIKQYESALAIARQHLAKENSVRLALMGNLANAYRAEDQLKKAVSLLESQIEILEKITVRSTVSGRLASYFGLQDAYTRQREFDKAEKIIEKWKRLLEESKAEPQQMAIADICLAAALAGQKKGEKAMAIVKPALEVQGISELQKLRGKTILALELARTGVFKEQEKQLLEAFEQLKQQLEETDVLQKWYSIRACERIIEFYKLWEKPARATEWSTELEKLNNAVTHEFESDVDKEN